MCELVPQCFHRVLVEEIKVKALLTSLFISLSRVLWNERKSSHHLRDRSLFRRAGIIVSINGDLLIVKELKEIYLDIVKYLYACAFVVKLRVF